MKRVINKKELRQIVPLSDTTVWELEQRKDFPSRFYLTPRLPVWDYDEVIDWLEKRKAVGASLVQPKHKPDVRTRKSRPVHKAV